MNEEIEPISVDEVNTGAYLLHLTSPNPNDDYEKFGDEIHFIGYSKNMLHQIAVNIAGEGAKVLKNTNAEFKLVATFPNHNPAELRRMLVALGAARFCPLCLQDEYNPPPRRGPKARGISWERIKYINLARQRLNKDKE